MTLPRAFERLSIRHKLVAMIMLTTAIVLMLASLGHLVNDYSQARDELRRQMRTLSDLVLENSSVALQFLEPGTANELLRTLARVPHLRAACLYSADGTLFGEYHPTQNPQPCTATAPGILDEFTWDAYVLATPLESDGRTIGSLYLHSDVRMIRDRLRTQVAIVLLLLVVALAVGFALSSRLQALVSQPLIALAGTAAEVSSKGDYGIRAVRRTDDELGVLVDAFNRMLERIQSREDELSRTNQDLRREIAERRRAEQERAELLVREREANRLKDEFLATLSHELRTPLNAILGWTRLLRANAVPGPGVDRALEKVERNAQVQTRLVEDLLEISRIVSGKLHLDMREVDLTSIVNRAVDSIRPAAEARKVSIERLFSASGLPTIADGDRLQQVVWNLLSNAVKFTPPGGRVRIRLQRHALMDELSVTDTGIGIRPEFLPNVFDTFRQADASSTRAHGGLGLGLSIVKHLVELHGGAVEAASAGPETGATFSVRLPIRTVGSGHEAEDHLVPAIREGTLMPTTVLVVDDDRDTQELVSVALHAAGARVLVAGTAAEALQRAMENHPDALISDIAMPEQDGYELLQTMTRVLGPRAPRVTIALTAFATAEDREKSKAAGFQRHLAKPFDPLELVRILEELLAGQHDLGSPAG